MPTYITPLLTAHARMGATTVTALFFGYGGAGVIGTLIGGRLVARNYIATFAVAGLLVDSAGLATVYTVAGSIALVSAIFAFVQRDRRRGVATTGEAELGALELSRWRGTRHRSG